MINLIIIVLSGVISFIFGLILFSASSSDKDVYMHYEKCNHIDCDTCMDKEQCQLGKERL